MHQVFQHAQWWIFVWSVEHLPYGQWHLQSTSQQQTWALTCFVLPVLLSVSNLPLMAISCLPVQQILLYPGVVLKPELLILLFSISEAVALKASHWKESCSNRGLLSFLHPCPPPRLSRLCHACPPMVTGTDQGLGKKGKHLTSSLVGSCSCLSQLCFIPALHLRYFCQGKKKCFPKI